MSDQRRRSRGEEGREKQNLRLAFLGRFLEEGPAASLSEYGEKLSAFLQSPGAVGIKCKYLSRPEDRDEVDQEMSIKLELLGQRAVPYKIETDSFFSVLLKKECLNLLRARARGTAGRTEQAPEEGEVGGVDGAPPIECSLELKEIWRFVEELEDKYREVLYLRYQEGLSFDEIAEVIEVSCASSARARHRRALDQLRPVLEEYAGEDLARLLPQAS